jgi:hypothetical protein
MTILATGDPQPVRVFGTDEPRVDREGRPLFKVPVLLSGTGERVDPTTTITVPGPVQPLPRGAQVRVKNLTLSTWTVRGNDNRERSGVTLRADSIEAQRA